MLAHSHAASSECMCVAHLGTRPFLSAGDNAPGRAENAGETRTHSLTGIEGSTNRGTRAYAVPFAAAPELASRAGGAGRAGTQDNSRINVKELTFVLE